MRALDVSDMTVRRDLEVLEGQGHLLKVHGGATLLRESAVHEPGFDTKRALEHEAKVAIARSAATPGGPRHGRGHLGRQHHL